jgi:hypothetical protein
VHTTVDLVFDVFRDRFLPGNHVVLTDRATQCLTSFSLDFERRSANHFGGPNMTVQGVRVDGRPARFRFARPTYPGDPRGASDPNPLAHEASQNDPVGGPHLDRLPPACTPELPVTADNPNTGNGRQCPATKLVITPARPIPNGAPFTVTVYYTGRPGVHNDGDASTEGWFRAGHVYLVSTEPVGTEDWMPVNNFPSAKPTYDFHDTVNVGQSALGNGLLVSVTRHSPDAEFPRGSVTWNWRSKSRIASYLVQSTIGDYQVAQHVGADGIRYYAAQSNAIPPDARRQNQAMMRQLENITDWEGRLTGRYPFASNGIVVGTPSVDSGEEEMQTMSSFNDGSIDLPTVYHEALHQWWGDNVTEANYSMTFFKEGFGQLAEYLLVARRAQQQSGPASSPRAHEAFDRSLIKQFDSTYDQPPSFWRKAPSKPSPWLLFDDSSAYERPAAAYIAVRQILGRVRFTQALTHIQHDYGGRSITEPELENEFVPALPNQSTPCRRRLRQFFSQWFDTAYQPGAHPHRPTITGPRLAGEDFYQPRGCTRA